MQHIILYIGILLGALSCSQNRFRPQTGDLLFLSSESGEMAQAIDAATGHDSVPTYSHVGIAVRTKAADSVLEATTEGGVKMTLLADFLARAGRIDGHPAVVAMRLRDTTGVTGAVARAHKLLGLPYDYSFLPDNGKFYCSELVWENYLTPEGSPRFPAQPMNFRAADGTMPDYWVDLFDSLGEPVPEGIPGTNPNDMARDSALVCIHRYY